MENNNGATPAPQSVPQGQTVQIPAASTNGNAVSNNTTPAPQVTQTSPMVTPTPQKKSSFFLWCIGIAVILGLLLLCCVCSFPVWISSAVKLNPNSDSFDRSSYVGVDTTSPTTTGTANLEQRYEDAKKANPGKPFTVTFTEKDLLNQALANSTGSDAEALKGILIRFEDNNKASMRIEISSLLANTNTQDTGGFQLKPEDFKDTYLGVDFSVSADGKSIEIDSITTGNSFIDSLLGEEAKRSIEDEINTALSRPVEGENVIVDKISIKKGQMSITFAPVTPAQ